MVISQLAYSLHLYMTFKTRVYDFKDCSLLISSFRCW